MALWFTGCKQGLGESCQVNTDCSSNRCSMSDPHLCVSTEGNTVGDIDAAVPAPGITAFAFLAAQNPGLASDVTAKITGTDIAAMMPAGTVVTALVATFATSPGAIVKLAGTDVDQTSGVTPHDFTGSIEYDVTRPDGPQQTYTVDVQVASVVPVDAAPDAPPDTP
jgi:hypothetical protein